MAKIVSDSGSGDSNPSTKITAITKINEDPENKGPNDVTENVMETNNENGNQNIESSTKDDNYTNNVDDNNDQDKKGIYIYI